jgi:uncharacterized protein
VGQEQERLQSAQTWREPQRGGPVFLDPDRIEICDDREDYGEDRWITIGAVESALLVVVYTVRDVGGDVIRLISARRANAQERKAYSHHQA